MRWKPSTRFSKYGRCGVVLAAIPVLLCLLFPACATTRPPGSTGDASSLPAPATRPTSATPPGAHLTLGDSLGVLLETTDARQALWAVFVKSLVSDDVLFAHQADRLMIPASTMKLITLAVAAERLGWDYRYETQLLSAGSVVDGVLRGDLIVRGSGDPTINTNAGDSDRAPVFESWAETLGAAGITAIAGRVVGDDNRVEDAALGYGWSWDDLPYGFATPGGALQHHDNVVRLTVRPGSVANENTIIELDSPASGVRVINRVVTTWPGEETELVLKRRRDGALEVRGWISARASPEYQTASVENPTIFFVQGLKETLQRLGTTVSGEAMDIDDLDTPHTGLDEGDLRVLTTHRSAPLSEIATTLMTVSQNLYAETLLRTLDEGHAEQTSAAGRNVVREVLESWGIDNTRFVIADGSGLSRYNYVTARTLVDVLQRMHTDPRHATPFRATLPVAARNGTLETRLTGTAAAGNVHAKTGSMSNVRALSGFVTSADGEPLAFAVLANNFPGPARPILAVIDRLVDQLASSTRSDSGHAEPFGRRRH